MTEDMIEEIKPTPAPKSRSKAKWVLFVLAALAAAGLLVSLAAAQRSPPEIVWLKKFPDYKPSLMEQAKWRLQRIPVVAKWFANHQVNVRYDCQVGGAETSLLAALREIQEPFSTNQNGDMGWLLSADKALLLKGKMRLVNGLEEATRPRMLMTDGGEGSVVVGADAQGNTFGIRLKGKIDGARFKLTQQCFAANTKNLASKLSACGAVVDNQGALVLWLGKDKTGYLPPASPYLWVIISPTVVDGKGNPIRLK